MDAKKLNFEELQKIEGGGNGTCTGAMEQIRTRVRNMFRWMTGTCTQTQSQDGTCGG